MLMGAMLKPASGGFGEYEWAESYRIEDGDTIEEFIDFLAGDKFEPEVYEGLNGRIRDERGVVLRVVTHTMNGEPQYAYEMVWEE